MVGVIRLHHGFGGMFRVVRRRRSGQLHKRISPSPIQARGFAHYVLGFIVVRYRVYGTYESCRVQQPGILFIFSLVMYGDILFSCRNSISLRFWSPHNLSDPLSPKKWFLGSGSPSTECSRV